MILTGKKIKKEKFEKEIKGKQEEIKKEKDQNKKFVLEKIVGCRKLKSRPVEYKINRKDTLKIQIAGSLKNVKLQRKNRKVS